jgi:hypothetical protein
MTRAGGIAPPAATPATMIDRLGPGGSTCREIHAARSRSQRSDVYSGWQISEPAGSGPSQSDQSRDGAEAPEQFKEGRHPRSACPEPTPSTVQPTLGAK